MIMNIMQARFKREIQKRHVQTLRKCRTDVTSVMLMYCAVPMEVHSHNLKLTEITVEPCL